MTLVHAFDQPQVVAGQGTIGLEIARQAPDVQLDGGAAGRRRPGQRDRRSPLASALPGRPRGGRAGGGVRALHRLARGPPADRRALGQHDLRRHRGQAPGRLHAAAGGALRGRGGDRLRRRGGRGDGAAARALEAGGGGRRRRGGGGADARAGRGARRTAARSARCCRAATSTPRCCPSASAWARRRPGGGWCSRRWCRTGRARWPGCCGWWPSTAATWWTWSTCATASTSTWARRRSSSCSRRAAATSSQEILDAARAEGFSVRVETDA